MIFSLFVSCPKGLEYLLLEELEALGLQKTKASPQGVYGDGDLALVYKLCLWSRIANRIQVILFTGRAHNQQALYQLGRDYPWQTAFSSDKSLAIECHGTSPEIRNTMFGAQVIKDSIVDYFRERDGTRPIIDRDEPLIRLHAYLKNDLCTVSLDCTGYSLHQRGYRLEAGIAPLKENVAAALLMRAGWPAMVAEGAGFYDPFCGAGTLVIEAAMMAAQMAPGLLRQDQAIQHTVYHQPSLWEQIRTDARNAATPLSTTLYGSDENAHSIHQAGANASRAGVASFVNFSALELNQCRPQDKKGLILCNPPYGERMGEENELVLIYNQLGQLAHAHYQDWQLFVLTQNPVLAKAIGLRSNKQYTIYNGALECKLYGFVLDETNKLKDHETTVLSSGAEMFRNRLRKNVSHLQKWATREQVSCFRVYDADLPEYAYAIDVYNDYAVLQEYKAPSTIPAHKVASRSIDVYQVVPEVLGIPRKQVVMKERKQQKGRDQYQKIDKKQQTMTVTEGRAKFIVNLYDYLDTGLFLDHRLLRRRFASLPNNTRFLNCFSYTSTASVHAALAGASTTNVDMSNTYLTWAQDNFRLNHLDLSKHQFIQADVLTWLKTTRDRFDVIFLDPPSFSNSKRMNETLDIQRDHESLIKAAAQLLYPLGKLYFSTNLRHFKLSPRIVDEYSVKEITSETIDLDFKRNARIHHCFLISNE